MNSRKFNKDIEQSPQDTYPGPLTTLPDNISRDGVCIISIVVLTIYIAFSCTNINVCCPLIIIVTVLGPNSTR